MQFGDKSQLNGFLLCQVYCVTGASSSMNEDQVNVPT